ncbi:MAG: PIG-L deacetylase family protein [Parasphingorhabdus sp.]|uniref:PIG-L deacetylase family protein n=1 Tax=Parasphingorhabdus sp. TaxID=2709688 RepID=UPI003001BAB3
MLSNAKRCLVLAAHADDETIGVGGTIAKLKNQGCRVAVAIATDGTSSQYHGNQEAFRRRQMQAEQAMSILGVDEIIYGPFPDMRLDGIPHIEINKWMESVISDQAPDLLMVHHPADVNFDHKCLFQSAMVASRPTPGQSIRIVLCYYVNSSTEWGILHPNESFRPQVFVNISTTLKTKLQAFSAYKDELRDAPHPRSLESLEITARYFGSISGHDAAEPFTIVRGLWK